MKRNNQTQVKSLFSSITLRRIVTSQIAGYLVIVGLIFSGLYTNQLINDLRSNKTHLQELQYQEKNASPAGIFFKDTEDSWSRVDIVDKSFSLPESALKYDLKDLFDNTKHRLIVFVADSSADEFEKEAGDITRLAAKSNASLLAINYTPADIRLNISPSANIQFTDQEVQKFVQESVKPAIDAQKLKLAIMLTIEKFQLELIGKNFYPASDIESAGSLVAVSGMAKDDYQQSMKWQNDSVAESETQLVKAWIMLAVLLGAGLVHVWRTHRRSYGFLLGMAVGCIGYVLVQNLTSTDAYYLYEESISSIIVAVLVGGVVGLLIDHLISVPRVDTRTGSDV